MITSEYQMHVTEAEIEDLHRRLAATRFPSPLADGSRKFGTEVSWARELRDYWLNEFDWRHHEAKLNAFPQFKMRVRGADIHWLEVPGKGPNPTPLLLLHGWPGSVFEFMDILPRLTDPASHGGNPEDAFTVVAPSLPGYGLSFGEGSPNLSIQQMAPLFIELMSSVLGYQRFGLQGGDWGAWLASRIALEAPDRCLGLHLNLLPRKDLAGVVASTPEEDAYLRQMDLWTRDGTGYGHEQSTRPQTLSFGLTDSPMGLAAWIAEKMRDWSDRNESGDPAISLDQILANVSFYWFTGAIASSFWPYYAKWHSEPIIPAEARIAVPMAYAEFPAEVMRPPRSMASRTFTNIRRWSSMPSGGHFAALEQPAALAREIELFFRELREAGRCALADSAPKTTNL